MENSKINRFAPLLFLLWSVLCQVCGFTVGILSQSFIEQQWLAIVLHSLVAFSLAKLLRLSAAWCILNLILPGFYFLYLSSGLSPEILAVCFIFLLLIYLPTFWTRVPYYPTSKSAYSKILELLPADRPFRCVDLGSGFGTLLFYLAKRRPQGEFLGVEISPLPFFLSWLRCRIGAHRNLSFSQKSFWGLSLSEFDYVYAFLAPGPMPRLWQKTKEELKPGATFITNTFEVDAPPEEIVSVDKDRQTALYVFRFGSKTQNTKVSA